MANAFKKAVAFSCCLGLVVSQGAYAQVRDGRDVKEPGRWWRRSKKEDTAPSRETPRAYLTERGQPGWRAPGDTLEMVRSIALPTYIGGMAFEDIRMLDSIGYGLGSENSIWLLRVMGDASQQIARLSAIGDVKDYFVYKGWPYYISRKNELRTVRESIRTSWLRKATAAVGQLIEARSPVGWTLGLTAGMSFFSWSGIFPFFNYHHIAWYIPAVGTFLIAGGIALSREMSRREVKPAPPSDIFRTVLARNVSAVRFQPETGDFEIDHFDGEAHTNKTSMISNLVGTQRARTLRSCADFLRAIYL